VDGGGFGQRWTGNDLFALDSWRWRTFRQLRVKTRSRNSIGEGMNLFARAARMCLVFLLPAFLGLAIGAPAQTATGSLRGQVLDPSGAAVAGATVLVLPAEGPTITSKTNRDGYYEAKVLPPGRYTVQVFATGFAPFEAKDIVVTAGSTAVLNARLS